MTPDEYCQRKTSASGSSFYYSFLFLPDIQRRAITALYAFCREVDDVVDASDDTDSAHKELDVWREEIERLFHATPQHPVTRALSQYVEQFNLAEEYFYEILDGMEMDLVNTHYQTFRELSLYCYRAASVVGLLSVEIFGYHDRNTLKYANDLGMAFQLTNILRDVQEDFARGRVYLPLDEMSEFGVTMEMLSRNQTNPSLRNLLKYQAERANKYYASALEHLPDVDRYRQRTGIIMAAIYREVLRKIETKAYSVLEGKVRLSTLQKIWIAWCTYRSENKRYKQYVNQ